MNQARFLLAFAAIVLTATSLAFAQRGGTGFGGSSFGGGGFGGMSGMSGFSGGMGGLNGGMGGFGSGGMGMGGMGGGMGGMGGGMGGFGTGMGMGGSGMGGFGQGGMGGMQGNNMQGNQGFVGRDSSDMASVFNQLGRNSNQFFQQLNRTMGRGNRRRNSSQEENAALAIRVRLDVAFDQPAVQPGVVANNVRTRLASTLAKRKITAPEVELVGDTIVLRGVVANESQRLVIEKLVSMEPGVAAVSNEMTVQEPSAADN
jgi:hypothetical protein